MKKIKEKAKDTKIRIFKAFATVLAACGISTYFTACYGMPVNYDNFVSFRVGEDLNGDGMISEGEYVEGIVISPEDISGEKGITDKAGLAELYVEYAPSADFRFDDDKNVFETKRCTVDFAEYDGKEITVMLERKSGSN